MARAKDEGRRMFRTEPTMPPRGSKAPAPTDSSRRRSGPPRRKASPETARPPVQRVDLWEEMDWVAVHCGLTPTEKAVLAMARLEEYSHAEIAAELGLTRRQVSETLIDALRKARARFDEAT